MTSRSQSSPPRKVDLAQVRALVEPIAVVHGVRLVDLEWTTGHGGRILRVVIERPEAAAGDRDAPGGVTLEDCVRVSRDVSTALDVDDPIAQAYSLEVSSPGLDRPLRSLDDFRRHVGKLAKVKLARPAADGQRVLRGCIVAVDAEHIRMAVDGNEHQVAPDDITDARPILEFGQQKSPTARGSRKGADRRQRRKRGARPGRKASSSQQSNADATRAAPRKVRGSNTAE